MADLTRRAFIGRTLLTGATIASGGLATISTSPTTPTVAKVATTFKNLNVLSPKAKAYRTFLRGLKHWTAVAAMPRTKDPGKNLIGTKLRSSGKLGSLITQGKGGGEVRGLRGSVARQSFEQSIRSSKDGFPIAESTTPGRRIARHIDPPTGPFIKDMKQRQSQLKSLGSMRAEEKGKTSVLKGNIARDLHKSARKDYANELRAQRVVTKAAKIHDTSFGQKRGGTMVKGVHTPDIQATKTTSTTSKGGGKSGGGGGKFGGNTFGRHSPWSLLRNDKNF